MILKSVNFCKEGAKPEKKCKQGKGQTLCGTIYLTLAMVQQLLVVVCKYISELLTDSEYSSCRLVEG